MRAARAVSDHTLNEIGRDQPGSVKVTVDTGGERNRSACKPNRASNADSERLLTNWAPHSLIAVTLLGLCLMQSAGVISVGLRC